MLNLSYETTYVILAIGTAITLGLTLLEKSLKDSLQLYNVISEINDEELARKIIELAKSVSKGEIPPEIATLRSRERLAHTRKYILASDYNPNSTLQGIYDWEDSSTKRSWYEATIEISKRGVSIERNFVLKRSEILRAGKFDERALSILKKQERDGVKVRIVWIEDLEKRPPQRDLLQGFAIYDGEEVVVETQFGRRWMYRTPSDKVKLYLEIFEEQKKYAVDLQDLLRDFPPTEKC